jgi:TatD DNase family protein
VSLIDTHCHINFDSFENDRADVIAHAAWAEVTRLIVPAIDQETSAQILPLCDTFAGVFAAVGIHPNSTADFSAADLEPITALAGHTKVVAIGEIGLDYYWDKSPKAQQIRAFEAQLELAAKLMLPVIIHNRSASEDTIAVLENWVSSLPDSLKDRPGVMHSFSGTEPTAERALAAGFYLGFTGPITYKNAEETRRIAAATPLDRILVETDAPFLTPVPHRGKRNEPAYIPLIVERLAAVKGLAAETIGRATTENASRLFRLP